MYEKWVPYYEILLHPLPSDLKDENGNDILNETKYVRDDPSWPGLSLREKEHSLWKIRKYAGPDADKDVTNIKWPKLLESVKVKQAFKTQAKIFKEQGPKKVERMKAAGKPLNIDLTPHWIKNLVEERNKLKRPKNMTSQECEANAECSQQFEDDHIVTKILGNSTKVKTPKRNENEPFCKEIVSIAAVQEELSVLALCRIGFGPNSGATDNAPYDYKNRLHQFYAIYTIHIKQNLPLIVAKRKSKRIFRCIPTENDLVVPKIGVQPQILRAQKSVSLFILNCKNIVFFSTNEGKHNHFTYHTKTVLFCLGFPGGRLTDKLTN